jgi:hypothetical protein
MIWDLGFGIWDLGLESKIEREIYFLQSKIQNLKFKSGAARVRETRAANFTEGFTVGYAEMIGKRQFLLVGDCASRQISPLIYQLALKLFSPDAENQTSWPRVR